MPLAQITVLALDDNGDTLQLFERYAANTRYRLVGLRDPEQALAAVKELADKKVAAIIGPLLSPIFPAGRPGRLCSAVTASAGWQVFGWAAHFLVYGVVYAAIGTCAAALPRLHGTTSSLGLMLIVVCAAAAALWLLRRRLRETEP